MGRGVQDSEFAKARTGMEGEESKEWQGGGGGNRLIAGRAWNFNSLE